MEPRTWQLVVAEWIFVCLMGLILLRAYWHLRRYQASKRYIRQLEILSPLSEPLRSRELSKARHTYEKAMRE